MMHKVGEAVLYSTEGVCIINDIKELTFGKDTSQYYVLNALYRKSSVTYIPVGNIKLESKMRKLLSKTEILELIDYIPNSTNIWIENEPERKSKYKEVIMGEDRYELARMIRTLLEHKEQQEKAGKKMHISDEKLLKDGIKILSDEIACILGVEHEKALLFITK